MDTNYKFDLCLEGQFLIAMPGLDDPNFSGTVTYVCVHNQDGAFGLIINRVAEGVGASLIFDNLEIDSERDLSRVPIYLGGPVHQGHLFVLHTQPLLWDATIITSESVAMTNSRDILEAIASGRGPDSYMLFLGCSGWGPGQLDGEILENTWLNCPLDLDILFNEKVENRWEKAAKSIGIDPQLLSETPGHA